jgi:hypothetical protein
VGGTKYINDAMFGTRGVYTIGVGFIGTMDTAQTCLQVDALVNERQIYTYDNRTNAIEEFVFKDEKITSIEIEGYTYASSNYSVFSVLSRNDYTKP